MRALPLLLTLLSLAACGLDTPQQYLIQDLRILAIRTQVLPPPSTASDVLPGSTFRLEALIANPSGSTSVDWFACLPPEVSGSPPPCLDEEKLRDSAAFEITPGVFRLGSGLALDVDTSASQPGMVTLVTAMNAAVVATLELASTVPSLQCRVAPEIPLVAIARSGASEQMALKRVRIDPSAQLALPAYAPLSDRYVLNLNPVAVGVYLNPSSPDDCTTGTPLLDGDPLPAGEVRICAQHGAESVQQFPQCQAEGAPLLVTEDLEWQWYVSGGEIAGASFDGNATGREIELTPPAGGAFTLWAIVRDGRGGTGWAVRTLSAP